MIQDQQRDSFSRDGRSEGQKMHNFIYVTESNPLCMCLNLMQCNRWQFVTILLDKQPIRQSNLVGRRDDLRLWTLDRWFLVSLSPDRFAGGNACFDGLVNLGC